MKLIELYIIETTSTHYIFTIKVETTGFWGKKTIESFDCTQGINTLIKRSRFISNGESIYHTWLYLDNAINAILSTKNKTYKRI